MVFIRAPRIVQTGPGVEVLAQRDGFPTLVRQGRIWPPPSTPSSPPTCASTGSSSRASPRPRENSQPGQIELSGLIVSSDPSENRSSRNRAGKNNRKKHGASNPKVGVISTSQRLLMPAAITHSTGKKRRAAGHRRPSACCSAAHRGATGGGGDDNWEDGDVDRGASAACALLLFTGSRRSASLPCWRDLFRPPWPHSWTHAHGACPRLATGPIAADSLLNTALLLLSCLTMERPAQYLPRDRRAGGVARAWAGRRLTAPFLGWGPRWRWEALFLAGQWMAWRRLAAGGLTFDRFSSPAPSSSIFSPACRPLICFWGLLRCSLPVRTGLAASCRTPPDRRRCHRLVLARHEPGLADAAGRAGAGAITKDKSGKP